VSDQTAHERLAPGHGPAFTALAAIERGEWDSHLARLSAAIRDRMRTSDWQRAVTRGQS
jgi:hypothetical protein